MRFTPFIYAGICALFFSCAPSYAAYTIKNGKLLHTHELSTMTVQEHYSAAIDAYQGEHWQELIRQMTIVMKNFPESPFAVDGNYYLGVGYYHLREFELANRCLSSYLKSQGAPKFFAEAIECKFAIAEQYQNGQKKHLLGMEGMPKWMPAREEAIEIFDEVITALPHHDLAAKALFGKAYLLFKDEDYKASIETYQSLIRKFPKHSLACDSYIAIGKVYLTQASEEYPDPDFLDLAEINLRKFKQDFPNESRKAEAEKMLSDMRELYAKNLYETAQFYERTKKPQASKIYYSKIVSKYPSTHIAMQSEERIAYLEQKFPSKPSDVKLKSDPTDQVVEQSSSAPNPTLEVVQSEKKAEEKQIGQEASEARNDSASQAALAKVEPAPAVQKEGEEAVEQKVALDTDESIKGSHENTRGESVP